MIAPCSVCRYPLMAVAPAAGSRCLGGERPARSLPHSGTQRQPRCRPLHPSASSSGAGGSTGGGQPAFGDAAAIEEFLRGPTGVGGEQWDGSPPSEEEMEEARKAVQDFFEGMGSAGVPGRPDDLDLPPGRFSREDVLGMVGMNGWRLADKACPTIEELVTQMENCWRTVLPEDQFELYPLEERFKYLDSADPEGADPFAFRSIPDPDKGQPGYPRLQIENRAYTSRAFRKMHIEVAVRQDGLQIFHCVMYPRLDVELPILSMDVVANGGRVSLAIVDPCPLTPNLQLPLLYEKPVRDLQAKYRLESNRTIPEWGRAIFSPLCIIMRPESGDDLGRFLKYALALTQMHVQIGKIAHPVSPNQRRRLEVLHEGHRRYCEQQLANDKTRRVLEAAFGAPLAERYMRECMFDCPPTLPANL